MTTVSVRYISDDVDTTVAFYVEHLGFDVEMHPGPGFAMLSRGDLRLLLNQPGAGGAGQPMPDGRTPEPGGWNRARAGGLGPRARGGGATCGWGQLPERDHQRAGGSQILLDDPSGNPVELFQPAD